MDEAGRTLYAFKNDSGGNSTCYDNCAQNWPPMLTTGSPQAGTGVDTALLGTTERTDGTTQVTYKDMPLYYFARDTAAGDVNGQGVGEVWYVVSPTGEMMD
jgi:predicted lipoprotein with Yx(FWY)xxD motif